MGKKNVRGFPADSYKRAVAEYQAACTAVKARKDIAFEEFRKLDKFRNHGGAEMALLEIDPFDVDAAREVAEATGAPVEMKHWLALARGLASSAFRDSEFAAATLKVIQTTAKSAIEEDQQLMAEVAAAEARLLEEKARLEEGVRQARAALCAHRKAVADGITRPALEADIYRVNDVPGTIAGYQGDRHIGVRFGVETSVQDQINGLLSLMVRDTKRRGDGNPYAHLSVQRGIHVPEAALTEDRFLASLNPLSSVAGPDGYGERGFPPIRVAEKTR